MKPATNEELASLGIDPDNMFASCERIANHPLDMNVRGHRLSRNKAGHVTLSFGYYTEAAKARREMYKKCIEDYINVKGNQHG